MELKVEEVKLPEVIAFNYDELKAELTEKVKTYETMIYTDEQIKEAKSDRANLNKLKKALNDERIRREKEYMQPFNEFKTKINEIIGIIDKPISVIDKQIKEADNKRKEAKQMEIGSLFVCQEFPSWVRLPMIFDETWLNAGTSMKQIEDNLIGWKNRIEAELATLASLPDFSFEATEVYKQTLDLNKAIAEGQRLADIQRRKQEAEARAKEEAEARAKEEFSAKVQAEAVEEAEAEERHLDASQYMTPPQEFEMWIKFEACLTVAQAQKLKAFFEENGIQFKAI